MSRAKAFFLCLFASGAALTTMSAAAVAQTPEIIIGGAFDLSGPSADTGKDALDGVQFAVEQLNNAGGVLGQKIQLKYLDGASNPQRGVDQGTILARDGAKFLLAPQTSSSAIASSKGVSKKLQIPMCSSTANVDDTTIKEFHPYIFSVSVNSYMEGRAIAEMLAKQPYKRYALMGADYAGPRAMNTRFKEFMKQYNPNAEIVLEEYPKYGATDYTAYINKLRAANPDYVMTILFGADLITFSKQAQALGFFDEIKGHFNALYDTNALRAMGESAPIGTEGYERAPFSQIIKNAPTGKNYIDAFRASRQRLPSDWATEGYECVMAWAQAVQKAKSVEPDAVMSAIETTEFDLPRGKMIFGKYDHQLEVPVYAGKVVQSQEFGQPILDITTIVPGSDVRPSKEALDEMRGK
jgi:branched-chain amino acid transport system substrate-binding protein